MQYRAIKGKRHYVYDHISEFYSEYPKETPLKNWREGKEGSWVWSDDEKIVQLLRVSGISHPNDRKNYRYSTGWCRTVVGTFLINNKTFMDTDFDSHNNRYTFSKTIGSKSNLRKRKYPTKKERIFTTSIVAGHGPVKAYMDAYNEDSENAAKKKAIVLLKQERIVKEIEKSVLDVAKENGLDHQYVLRKLKHLADYSEDDNIMLQSVKEIGKIIGTSGLTIKQREVGIMGMFQGFSPEQLEGAERRMINGNISDSETTYAGEEE